MNDFEARKEARIDRYLARAEKARAESNAGYKAAKRIGDMIPF